VPARFRPHGQQGRAVAGFNGAMLAAAPNLGSATGPFRLVVVDLDTAKGPDDTYAV
jgi:hypothetical protein